MNKKSSPDDIADTGEFKAIVFSPEGKISQFDGGVSDLSPGFNIQGGIWEALLGEPELRARLDQWVESRVEKRVEEALLEKGEKVERQAQQKGFELGRSQAQAEAVESEERLKMVCDELIHQTNQILRSHEKIWIEALHRVLHAFLVDRPEPRLEVIEKWLQTNREEFLSRGRIIVYLSPGDFGASLPLSEAGKWEWRLDTSLKHGEIRAESDGAGIFFSPEEQWRKLEEVLSQAMRGPNEP